VHDATGEDDDTEEDEPPLPPPVASTSKAVPAPVPSPSKKRSAPPATGKLPPEDRKLLLSETVDVHLFDEATHQFMLQERDVQANLWLVRGQDFPCWLSVAGAGGQVWISMAIDADIPVHFTEVRDLSLERASADSDDRPSALSSSISPTTNSSRSLPGYYAPQRPRSLSDSTRASRRRSLRPARVPMRRPSSRCAFLGLL
jgi:hypothetical protein